MGCDARGQTWQTWAGRRERGASMRKNPASRAGSSHQKRPVNLFGKLWRRAFRLGSEGWAKERRAMSL